MDSVEQYIRLVGTKDSTDAEITSILEFEMRQDKDQDKSSVMFVDQPIGVILQRMGVALPSRATGKWHIDRWYSRNTLLMVLFCFGFISLSPR